MSFPVNPGNPETIRFRGKLALRRGFCYSWKYDVRGSRLVCAEADDKAGEDAGGTNRVFQLLSEWRGMPMRTSAVRTLSPARPRRRARPAGTPAVRIAFPTHAEVDENRKPFVLEVRMSAPNSLPRFWIPLAIVLFWGGMMGSLFRDRILPERMRASQALVDDEVLASKWHDITEWSWIYRQGRRCGASGMTLVQEEHPEREWRDRVTYRLDQMTTLDVAMLGQQQTVVMKVAVQLLRDFRVDRFRAVAETPLLTLECEGFAESDRVYYRVRHVTGEQKQAASTYEYGYIEVGRQALSMIDAVKPMMARHGNLVVGETYSVDVFDPFGGMNAQKAVVRVAGKDQIQVEQTQHDCFRLETTVGDITRRTWVDEMGQTIRREILMGYVGEVSSWSRIARVYPTLAEKIALPENMDRSELKTRAEAVSLKPAAPLLSLLGLAPGLAGNGGADTSSSLSEKTGTPEPSEVTHSSGEDQP